jgi:hypothetical protein
LSACRPEREEEGAFLANSTTKRNSDVEAHSGQAQA